MRYRVVTTYLMYLLLVPSLAQQLRARVAGGTAEAGRLEIFEHGTWNTVCEHGFGNKEASVACRMLGFNSTRAAAVGSVKYGQGSGGILFNHWRCLGNETSLEQCAPREPYVHNCRHLDDVGVMCNIAQQLRARVVGGTAEAGRLEIFEHGTWNTVCEHGFGHKEASVACRMLGFNSTRAAAVGSVKYGQGSGGILSNSWRCLGNETSLAQCEPRGPYEHHCHHLDDVGVMCNINLQMAARLAHLTSNAGRLEIFIDGEWGTVCGERFGEKEAEVACRMLGFNSTEVAAISLAFLSHSEGQVLLTYVQCQGTESSLEQCNFGPLYSRRCHPGDEVGVICNNRSATTTTTSRTSDIMTTSTTAGICAVIPANLSAVPGQVAYLTSPRYPANYYNNADCGKLIIAPVGSVVKATVMNVSLELNYDFVQIFDGLSTSSPSLVKLYSMPNQTVYYSSGQYMYIRFHSDRSYRSSGFRLTYEAIKPSVPTSATTTSSTRGPTITARTPDLTPITTTESPRHRCMCTCSCVSTCSRP